ncbi:dihydrodipicolinate synthase family protein [Symbiopectobacterium purcellii]|uniref:Dihydrodipicolinate synthase family protein n=1 Tax=Symbiopectobacterium purcellii TaxID=2871826 RepID=A0ABX9APP9_9ENTR|nr:dihydrodipicolinate synthase family protein [Symbiopectobacterium purcellii]QZN97138.1 dihydrodipicolinate synthase family protein [Symbiopectobacterium purcellii]
MFSGFSAFPLTPLKNGDIDETAFTGLLQIITAAEVDSIGVIGSTGNYAYLTRAQRYRATEIAVELAGSIPVMSSIGAVSTDEVIRLANDAQKAGVKGVMMAPVSYQKLTSEEVFGFYERVTGELSVPLYIYDNPATTGFSFDDELLMRLSFLPNVSSVKLGFLETDLSLATQRIGKLKASFCEGVTLGISGDGRAVRGLMAGCDVYYSALGGLYPRELLEMAHSVLRGDVQRAIDLNALFEPIWAYFSQYGSLRTIASIAELRGLVQSPCLPSPLLSLTGEDRTMLAQIISKLELE